MSFKRSISAICMSFFGTAIFLTAPVFAEYEDRQQAIKQFEPGEHVNKAVAMLEAQLEKSLDSRIPEVLLQRAKCAALFPEVAQAGIGIGGKFGRGIVSCRQPDGSWGVPVFLRLNSLSIGLQVGAQSADILMLIMQDDGLNTLFSGKPILGAEAGIAVGPVGRAASANIDIALQAPIVTYVRTQGVFAGAVWEGATITPAKKVNRGLYGDGYENAKSLLFSTMPVPENVQGLRSALDKYAPVKTS